MAVASTAASTLIRRANLALSMPYVAPDGELETLIAKLFAEVLTLDHVGADDDFAELGGDSLLGEVLSMRISEGTEFDFEIPLLVEHGSPRRIIALLRSKGVVAPSYRSRQAENHLGSRVKIVCLQQGNDNTPLYCMPTISGSVSKYIELAKILGGDRPVYGIQIADQAQTGKSDGFCIPAGNGCVHSRQTSDASPGWSHLSDWIFVWWILGDRSRAATGRTRQACSFRGDDRHDAWTRRAYALAYRIYNFARNVGPWALNFAPWAVKVTTKEITRRETLGEFSQNHFAEVKGATLKCNLRIGIKPCRKVAGISSIKISSISRKYRFEGIYRGTIFLFRQRTSDCSSSTVYSGQSS